MFTQLCVLAILAGAMALPEIEHRAEHGPLGNDLSKYYAKFQEYLNRNLKLDSPVSGNDQTDLQNPEVPDTRENQNEISQGMQGYQNQIQQELQGYGNPSTVQSQYSEFMKNCMSSYTSGFPSYPGQSDSSSSSSAASSTSNFQDQWKSCSQSWSRIPGVSSLGSSSPSSSSNSG